jgi:hypothetical protein
MITLLLKSGDVDNCILYEETPVTAFQISDKLSGWLAALFTGVASVGTAGARGCVEKLHPSDHSLVPPLFFAFTR